MISGKRVGLVRWEEPSQVNAFGTEIADYIAFCEKIRDERPNAMEISEQLGEGHGDVLRCLRMMEWRGLAEREDRMYEHSHPQERPFMVRYGLRD